MSTFITITQLETAINRALKIQPPHNYVLSDDVSAMAVTYAAMIIKKHAIDVDQLPDGQRKVIQKYLQTIPTAVDASAACQLSRGDPGADTCDACQ